MMPDYGLGRLPAPDNRDRLHMMRAIATPPPVQRVGRWIYTRGPLLDQGATSTCVGQAWRDWLTGVPMTTSGGPSAFAIYDAATQLDEWADNDHDANRQFGTSVRAGAKALDAAGHVERYLWAWRVDDVLDWMLTGRGGVVLGVNWYGSFFDPDGEGIIRITTNRVAGGHAIYAFGADEVAGFIYLQNSWGSWGGWKVNKRRAYDGCARLPLEDLDRLIREDGEAATAVQKRVLFRRPT